VGSNKTATGALFEKREEEQRQQHFERLTYRFFERWTPENREDAVAFNADLIALIRQLHMDAQEPIKDVMLQALRMQTRPLHTIGGA